MNRLGTKQYEFSDHLGNVLVTVTDKRTGTGNVGGNYTGWLANVSAVNDYYPFGFQMSERSAGIGGRYSFNGMEQDNEVKGNGNSLDFGARMYDIRFARWTAIDPLAAKYPMWSPYVFCADDPIRYIDPDGREFVDPNGKRVAITYMKDGSLKFSKNATADIIRVANALNLTSAGRTELKKIDQSDIKIKINITSDSKIEKRDDGSTSYTYGEAIQGNFKKSDNYGRKVNADGTYGIKEATIAIYEGTIQEGIKEGSGLKHEGLTLEQAIGAVVGHEGVHATDKAEINKDLKAEMKGESHTERETKPNRIEQKIIDQSKKLNE